MFNASGEQVIAGILAGDPVAIAEAGHRSSKQVKAALATVATPAQPRPKSRARKTGPGSRGGNASKYARTIYAEALSGERAPHPSFWDAYKSVGAHEFAEGITSHAEANKHLALLLAGE